MDFPKINLHIHSTFSDGTNSIKQIVKKALKLELNNIAITDHFSNSWKAGVISTLNTNEKIADYLKEISKFQTYLRENNKDLTLYKGIEIDLGSSEKVIKKLIKSEYFDIILFEYLETLEGIAFTKKIINRWKRLVKKSNENNFPILGLAHFDPSYFIHGGIDILIQFLKENSVYFEFNSSYPQYYSQKNELFFEKLKKYKIPVAIGSDAHNLKGLADIEEPLNMIRIYNLENNFKILIDLLK